jgi:uncharacterized protein YecA (UPF0149 family)
MSINGMIAICDNPLCGAIFEIKSLIGGPGNAIIKSINTKIGPCPKCGQFGTVPDGVYEYKSYLLSFINGPKESIDVLNKIKTVLENHRQNSQFATKQDIINEIEKISPRIAEVVKKAPSTTNTTTWIKIGIATITLLIFTQQTYFKPKQKEDSNKFTELFIQHLLNENQTIKKENLVLDSLNKATLTDKKIGRNDPCPCKSGKKFKNCCGNPIKK